MKIYHYIFLSFLFILLLFAFTTYINFRQSEEVKENAEFFSRSTAIARNATRLQRNTLNMSSGLRGYLLTGEHDFIQAYESTEQENQTILRELSALVPADSEQGRLLAQIQVLHNSWTEQIAEPLRQAKQLSGVSDSSLAAFNKLYRDRLISGRERGIHLELQDKLKEFSNNEYGARDQNKQRLALSIQQTRNLSFYLTSFSIIAGLAIAGILAFSLSHRITKMVNMANSIARGNYEVHMKDTGRDELSRLARSLNHMASVLSENISLLKRKNQELDQFAHVVSHDMKAPLRGIGNVISWIEEDHAAEISPKMNEYLSMIKGRLSRGENLIQGLLSYARVDREVTLKEEVDVNALIREIAETNGLSPHIRLSVQKNLPVLYTHRFPLLQVFSNLISNASKHHDKAEGEIKIYYKRSGQRLEFFVEDDGPGIDKIYHQKIFTIFQTLQDRDSFESTGVGLAIVKKILDERKETIRLESEPGRGSIFSFTWSNEA
ncbi:ATP-binding protein [Paraflavisolibacter sp. H34]|uniref:sensor histidine kinase n=1 Tax=Huijunlia imazamoxiresistens TaxID=3127457 RepID=UPI0030184776